MSFVSQPVLPESQDFSLMLDPSRDQLLTDFGKTTLDNQYLHPGETYQKLFERVSKAYGDNPEHSQRLYDYMSRLWFMPATPILANGGTSRGLPISCFLNEVQDSLTGIVDTWVENAWLASKGGGIGTYWGHLRAINEKISNNGSAVGVIPFIKVAESLTLAISQGSLRRGSAAVYLPISHPEIEEFVEIRKPTGGDHNRKTVQLNHGVTITNDFMEAVEKDLPWQLTSPKTGQVLQTVSARALWIRILTARIETGEPYIIFIDHVNEAIPEHHKQKNLKVRMSNLCTEIMLPTGSDHLNNRRTAVCCLSSLNLETYFQWKDDPLFVEDCFRFLDNVLSDFIQNGPPEMRHAVYSASRERSVGLGIMGWHAFLQQQNIPMESPVAKSWNLKIFKTLKEQADAVSQKLAQERGACPDAQDCGVQERFSNKLAIAPTASISIICGGTSPSIEPFPSNAYTHKTLSGSFPIRNRYLQKCLEEKGQDNAEVWLSIIQREGSVQHLDFLTSLEKAVFKTAFEMDQRVLIELAADRTPYICQAQSLNLFLSSDVHKKDLHHIHFQAWKKGVKSLYYLRSRSLQRAESHLSAQGVGKDLNLKELENALPLNYEECLSCQ
jgi:ribonucleoside-diphosphate reductase alpha chain